MQKKILPKDLAHFCLEIVIPKIPTYYDQNIF
jgi:hypothetical protein